MANTPEGRIRIIAENLARAALAEMKRDVEGAGAAATGATSGFKGMVFQQGHLIASTQGARRGLNIVENGLRTLAFQAAGVPGPVGKIASGFGLLGAGSLVVTGAVAGAGALALGYRMLTKDAREAGEAADKLTDSLKKQTLGGQFRDIGANLTEAGQGTFNAQVKVEQGGGPIWEWMAMIRQGALEEAGEKAVAAVLAVRDARATAHADLATQLDREATLIGTTAAEAARLKAAWMGLTAAETENYVAAVAGLERRKAAAAHADMTKQLEREADLIGLTTAEAARLRAGWMGLTEAETANYVAATTRLEQRKEENRVLLIQRDLLEEIGRISREVSDFGAFVAPDLAGLKLPDILADESARQAGLQVADIEKQGGQFAFENFGQDFFDQVQGDVDAAIGSLEKAGGGAKRFGLIAAQSLAFLGATQQGGAGGIITAGGGLLSGLSELKGLGGLGPIGIITTALGGVFSFFDHGQDRRQREMMDELKRIRENTDKRGELGQVNVTVLLNGRDVTAELLPQVMYGIRRAERTNAVPVLPPSGG